MMEQVPACPVVEAMLVAGTRCEIRGLRVLAVAERRSATTGARKAFFYLTKLEKHSFWALLIELNILINSV
jgi:hypothetical protein